jgi:tetratricopeptide (TPR) repeat protein
MNNKPFFWIVVPSIGFALCQSFAWAASVSPEQNRNIGRYTQEALQAFTEGQYEKAQQSFQSVLKLDPKDPVAQKGLRQCRAKIRARKPFNPKIDPPSVKTVKKYIRKQDWMNAIEDVQWILSRSPLDAGAIQSQNEIAASLKKREFESEEGSFDQSALQGYSHYLNRRYGEASSAWRKAAELSPSDKDRSRLSAYADKAEALHQEQVRSETLLTERARAKAALEAGNEEEAVRAWKKILEVSPDDIQAKEGVAKAGDSTRRKNKNQLIALYAEEGAALFKEGKNIASLKNWEAVAEIDPENPKAKDYIHRIRSKGVVKKPTPLQAWKAASAKPAPAPVPTPAPALSKEDEGDEMEAPEPAAKPSVDADAESGADSGSQYDKGAALFKAGNLDGAERVFRKILDKNPQDAKASEWLERIRANRSDEADDHYNQGLLAYAQGDTKQAIRERKAALQINPDHVSSKRALQRAMK